jgi:NAD(P)H-binding
VAIDEAHDLRGDGRYWSASPRAGRRCRPRLHTAVVRNPKKLSRQVRVVTVDLATTDPAVLESAVAGADAVLSGLGPRSAYEMGIAFQGSRAIFQANQATDVRPLVVVSAAPVSTVPSPGRPKPPRHDPGDGFFMRHLGAPLHKAALRGRYADLALMEDIERPGLDHRPAGTADRQAAERQLPHGVRAAIIC